MNTHRLFLMLLAITLGPTGLTAQEKSAPKVKDGQKESAPEWAALFGGAALPVVWQSAHAAAAKIAVALNERTFDGVADWAETIHLASHALADQVKLDDAERAKRLNGALQQAAKVADDVLDAANHKEAEKLADSFRRLNAALRLAAGRLPKAIVDAPAQEVRFVKAAGQAHGEKSDPVPKK